MRQWSLDARSSRQSCPYPKDETGHRKGERKARGSLDARSLAQPCYLPQENHRPEERGGKRLKVSATRRRPLAYLNPTISLRSSQTARSTILTRILLYSSIDALSH
jgi:hypothetical protein